MVSGSGSASIAAWNREHGGSTFGYRTKLLRFPEQRFSVITLCNLANADVDSLARKVADLYLEAQLKPEASVGSGSFPGPEPFAGTYFDHRTHVVYIFTAVNGDLMAWGSKLQRLSLNDFSDLVGNPIVFKSANGTK